MHSSFNPVAPGYSRHPAIAGPSAAVRPAALGAVREADASMAAEDWVYAPASEPAVRRPNYPPAPAAAR